jgi:quercetin dioxygenase-like cupin family protein
MNIRRVDVRQFGDKLTKLNLFSTAHFFLDVYCLEPGQAQKPHAHAAADKVYAVLEGEVEVQVGAETATLRVGDAVLAPAGPDHGVRNVSGARAALLVLMAPNP